MADLAPAHTPHIQVIQGVPDPVFAGTGILLKFAVACSQGCDLLGTHVRVLAQDDSIVTDTPLIRSQDDTYETDELLVRAPVTLGAHTWHVILPEQTTGEMVHAAGPVTIEFTVRPHVTTVAVWDWPSPTEMNAPFEIKVGVKCACGCSLAGKGFEVYDANGTRLTAGTLKETPWPQTEALYWADACLTAPATEQVHTWSCRFPTAGFDVPHDEATQTFYFRTTRPPEHTMTLTVTDMDTKLPIAKAQVAIDVFRAETDSHGVARLQIPTGRHEIQVFVRDYRMHQAIVDVAADTSLALEMIPDPF